MQSTRDSNGDVSDVGIRRGGTRRYRSHRESCSANAAGHVPHDRSLPHRRNSLLRGSCSACNRFDAVVGEFRSERSNSRTTLATLLRKRRSALEGGGRTREAVSNQSSRKSFAIG